LAEFLPTTAVNVLFVPLIAIAARRNPTWDLDIFVSRQVVFYSTTLVAVGLYLLFMSLGGYALVLYGGSWGALAKVVFFVGALLVLMFLLFSSTLRARVKVFLSKHFFRNKYDHREEWLRLVATLSEFETTSTREIVIKAMVQIVGSPSGVLWILDESDRRYRVSASYETDASLPDVTADEPLIEFMARESWLVDVDEYNAEPDIYVDLNLPQWLLDNEDAWLIVPLSTRQQLVGMILVNRPPVKMSLNYEDRDLLKTVGSHIAVHLAQEKSDSMLTEARQFETYNRLTAFLMHDLNNLIAQQSLIVENAETHKRNPDFVDDAIETIAGSVQRMKRVMRQLKRDETDRTKVPCLGCCR
jgi:putative PEP-CTERM system histidine kinase